MDIQTAITHLQERGLRLPHDAMPGSIPGGCDSDFTEEEWNAYTWNPPGGLPGLEIDPDASLKPSWDKISAAHEEGLFEQTRQNLKRDLKREVRSRIQTQYGADNFQDEMFKRLRGEATEAQDRERDRLLAVYRTLQDLIVAAPNDELDNINLKADHIWKAAAPPE